MSVFHGPQPGEKTDRGPNRRKGPKGALRMHRALLHEEAVARAEKKKGKKDEPVETVVEEPVESPRPPRKRRRRKVSGEGASLDKQDD